MQRQVTARRDRCAGALAKRAGQGLLRKVVTHEHTTEPNRIANHFAHHCDRSGAGAMGSMALNTTCAVMAIGRPASGLNAAKSVTSSVARSALPTGRRLWLSAVARPW